MKGIQNEVGDERVERKGGKGSREKDGVHRGKH